MHRSTGLGLLVLVSVLWVSAAGCKEAASPDNGGSLAGTGAAGTAGAAGALPDGAGGALAGAGGGGGETGEQSGSGGASGAEVCGTGGGTEAGTGGVGGDAGAGTGGAAGSAAGAGGDGGGSANGCLGAFQFTANAEGGTAKPLCDFAGDVLLIVNVAANCGFTLQLAGLAQLQNDYNSQGFNVLGFWNNQFMAQMGDPARRDQVKTQYGVNFPLFDEINVNAPNEHPLYTWLKAEAGGGNVGWNFEKFLIARDGSVIKRYLTQITPEQIATDIESAL